MSLPSLSRVAVAIAMLAACDGAPRESSANAQPAQPKAEAAETPDAPDPEPAPAAGESGEPAADDETGSAAEPPAPDVKPEDYGHIKPPIDPPSEDELTVHALAGFEVVAIYSAPNLESPRLGYLRFGQRTMVTPKIEDEGEGCRKGFHALPAGGFACASKGLLVNEEKEPYMYLPPPPPRLDEPLPYDYGTIGKDGTPMWWRIADRDEVRLADEKYAAMVEPEPEPGSPTPAKPKPKPAGDGGAALPGVDDTPPPPVVPLTEEQRAELERKREEARIKAEERAEELAKKAANLPLNSDKPFLEKGLHHHAQRARQGEGPRLVANHARRLRGE